MKNSDSYQRFQDSIFREIQDREKLATIAAVEHFVHHAATKGFPLDRLIEMADSGMSGAEIWKAVDHDSPGAVGSQDSS